MINVEKCKLSPVPSLRAGALSPEEVQGIARCFLNWNPATGSYPGVPSRFGAQPFRMRLRGPKFFRENDERIFESLDKDGQVNPVLMWQRWGSLFGMHGFTRILWALDRKCELKALIVDYDSLWTHWRKVGYRSVVKEFSEPPMGTVPAKFGWKDGIDYVLADAHEWEIMDVSKRAKKVSASVVDGLNVSGS